MFHLAYLVGSLIATRLVLGEAALDVAPQDVADPGRVLR